MKENYQISNIQELMTTVGASLFAIENLVVQFDRRPIGSVVETLVIEIDQERYEKYLFLNSSSSEPKCHCRVTTKKGEALSPTKTDKVPHQN